MITTCAPLAPADPAVELVLAICGLLIGLLIWVIRSFGGYPDAVAFSVLLLNLSAPFIDYYTQPRTYGHSKKRASGQEKD